MADNERIRELSYRVAQHKAHLQDQLDQYHSGEGDPDPTLAKAAHHAAVIQVLLQQLDEAWRTSSCPSAPSSAG